jgi:hypothetical protein
MPSAHSKAARRSRSHRSKSATDVFTVTVAQARKTFDTASAQKKELWGLPRSLRRKRASRSRSTSPRSCTKPAKKQHSIHVQGSFKREPGRLEQAPPRACFPHARSNNRQVRCPPSNRTDKRRNPTGRSFASKSNNTNSKGGSHRYGHGQMPTIRTGDPHRHQDRSRELSAQHGVFRAHPLPDLPHRSRLVRAGSLGLRVERLGAASQCGLLA